MQGRADAVDDAIDAAETVRAPLRARCGTSCTSSRSSRRTTATRSGPGSAGSTTSASRSTRSAWSRRPAPRHGPARGRRRESPLPRPRARAADRPRRARGPGPAPAQRPARVPGLARVRTSAARSTERGRRSLAARRPRSRRWQTLLPAIGPDRDALQAYCDVLEEKWILSELAGTRRRAAGGDRRLPRARRAGAGGRPDGGESPIALDIDWSSGWDDEAT